MKLSENWLREWVNPELSTEALIEKLTLAGLEVDGVSAVADKFSGVVIGEVKQVSPHPNADKLRLCMVDVAAKEDIAIVCGAANVRVGIKVPVAMVGAVLANNFKIKKAKLRGIPSHGMLCAASELGLAQQSEGLMVLPASAPIGEDIRTYLQLEDHCIDIDLTPNRSDCLSIAGIARELGALVNQDVNIVDTAPIAVTSNKKTSITLAPTAQKACPLYFGRHIENIDMTAETPIAIKEKLRRSGIRSVNPVVDITNYVMIELGQPMHAFDADKIDGDITVRYATPTEKMVSLDGKNIELNDDTVVISDQQSVLAMAGIMGGANSAVSEKTRHIFLESAFFTPLAIAGKARQYGLHTESSHRFERGVDPELASQAMARLTSLLLSVVGGQVAQVHSATVAAYLPEKRLIFLRKNRIKAVLGITISERTVETQLRRLGLEVEVEQDGWQVTVPSFRFDINLEVDLIEELGRLYGYDKLPETRPITRLLTTDLAEKKVSRSDIYAALVNRGYQEAITYSFTDPKLQSYFSTLDSLTLNNPISSGLSVMRTSLWPGLVQALMRNLNRQHNRVRLFEVGRVFFGDVDNIKQQQYVGGVITGTRRPEQWTVEKQPLDFFDLKGDVSALFEVSQSTVKYIADSHCALHPGQSARIEQAGKTIGWLGALHPQLQTELGIEQTVYLFEIKLDALLSKVLPHFSSVSKFPLLRRDLALSVPKSVSFDEVNDCLQTGKSDILKSIELFDVYEGEGVEEGYKSLAVAFYLQDSTQTLTDNQVSDVMQDITTRLEQQLAVRVRE
ncbi:MAG TPA: phenylalanine--tRNA ligase subunit beta [Gammaproteobacteria bacterium]|nr:phenylalanine--tRNA ligase subunit beta [Gammaproteobacteria bacterium]